MIPSLLVAHLAIGRLFIWTLQVASPVRHFVNKSEFVTELFDCDFCLGFWVFWTLSFWTKVNLIYELPSVHPVFAYFVTALICSFVVHVFRIGWKVKFHE